MAWAEYPATWKSGTWKGLTPSGRGELPGSGARRYAAQKMSVEMPASLPSDSDQTPTDQGCCLDQLPVE